MDVLSRLTVILILVAACKETERKPEQGQSASRPTEPSNGDEKKSGIEGYAWKAITPGAEFGGGLVSQAMGVGAPPEQLKQAKQCETGSSPAPCIALVDWVAPIGEALSVRLMVHGDGPRLEVGQQALRYQDLAAAAIAQACQAGDEPICTIVEQAKGAAGKLRHGLEEARAKKVGLRGVDIVRDATEARAPRGLIEEAKACASAPVADSLSAHNRSAQRACLAIADWLTSTATSLDNGKSGDLFAAALVAKMKACDLGDVEMCALVPASR